MFSFFKSSKPNVKLFYHRFRQGTDFGRFCLLDEKIFSRCMDHISVKERFEASTFVVKSAFGSKYDSVLLMYLELISEL